MDSENTSTETPEVKQEDEKPDLAGLLTKFPGAPNSVQIESWKEEHGEIFCSAFSETELFIFRPVTWREHKEFQKLLTTPPKEDEEPITEFDYQEQVVQAVLLWTSVKKLGSKGGNIPTLFEQVMANSNFCSPQVALQFVIRL